jgi:hypothetical protein
MHSRTPPPAAAHRRHSHLGDDDDGVLADIICRSLADGSVAYVPSLICVRGSSSKVPVSASVIVRCRRSSRSRR